MAQCSCGGDITGAAFCGDCGKPTGPATQPEPAYCGNCGEDVTGAKFCGGCGQPTERELPTPQENEHPDSEEGVELSTLSSETPGEAALPGQILEPAAPFLRGESTPTETDLEHEIQMLKKLKVGDVVEVSCWHRHLPYKSRVRVEKLATELFKANEVKLVDGDEKVYYVNSAKLQYENAPTPTESDVAIV
eukprot:TRINITY_DN22844_c0_g1_i10.p1 TRINITY_DN22844_c0_g1~~TRINITY_DN22844_c0_g1_i10.p1  ORF type:complete len:191 (-),score=30.29 TRINITY_DN22844_c0_g1_i10:273-845(-)